MTKHAELEVTPPKKKKKRPGRPKGLTNKKRKERDLQIAELSLTGSTSEQIAQKMGMSQRTVQRSLNRFKADFPTLKRLKDYKLVKEELLSAAELEFLKLMNSQDKTSRANLSALTQAFRAVHQANRLEQGKPTELKASLQFTRVSFDDVDDLG